MNLKQHILRALYGSAFIGLGVSSMAACGTTDDTDTGSNKDWKIGEETPDTGSTDMNEPDMDVPDMAPIDMQVDPCVIPGARYTNYPNDPIMDDGTTHSAIVCAPSASVTCLPSEELDYDKTDAFLRTSFNYDSNECSGLPQPYVDQGRACGPLQDRPGECCYKMDISFNYCFEGRPFTVDGLARLAQVTERDGWCDMLDIPEIAELPDTLRQEIACAWADAGTHEHASVASFAQFIMELMSLGAPRRLVDAATTAMSDEIRHAHDSFSIASAYAGKALGPDIVQVAGSLARVEDEVEILRAAIHEACIGETLAASVAQWMAPKAVNADVRRVFGQIAQEEGNHAQLGWEFVQWMLLSKPHLIDEARACFEESYESPHSVWALGMTGEDRLLVSHGAIRAPLEDHVRRHAYHHIVLPCADALFASLDELVNHQASHA